MSANDEIWPSKNEGLALPPFSYYLFFKDFDAFDEVELFKGVLQVRSVTRPIFLKNCQRWESNTGHGNLQNSWIQKSDIESSGFDPILGQQP